MARGVGQQRDRQGVGAPAAPLRQRGPVLVDDVDARGAAVLPDGDVEPAALVELRPAAGTARGQRHR